MIETIKDIDVTNLNVYKCGFCHSDFPTYIELMEHIPVCEERRKWLKQHSTIYVHRKISFETTLKNFGEGLNE